jgi:prepilin-type N-terminal cleavage/methylation domain-containing protein
MCNHAISSSRAHRQSGVTLVELLVGLAVGAIVLIGVIFSWGLAVRNNAYVLTVTALNNDMRSMMQIITQDVRRANQNPAGDTVAISVDGSCVVFNSVFAPNAVDDVLDSQFAILTPSGYRLVGGRLEVWWHGGEVNDAALALAGRCADNSNWETVFQSGDRGIFLEAFEVDASDSYCLDIETADPSAPWPEADNRLCTAGETEKVELLLLRIALAGNLQLAGEARRFEFRDSVKIRNDRVIE